MTDVIPSDLLEYHSANGFAYETFPLQLSYDNYSVDEVLQKVLPPNTEIPSSFEQAGHIAHLNIREELLPFKYTIGAVIMDKNSNIKTVVNKVGSIETEFRTFPMEVGADCMYGCYRHHYI